MTQNSNVGVFIDILLGWANNLDGLIQHLYRQVFSKGRSDGYTEFNLRLYG